jgi:2-succinyl-6-hydroxy-2,4-cyclohexadiene-1-carboxylate synthase
MSRLVLDGLRWEVRTRGAGRPVLLLHGFTGRGTSWAPHAAAWAHRFRVVTVDLPGHGRSAFAAASRMTVERTADDLAAILLRLDASPASVVGYSLGARIALRLAIAHPRTVDRLVLESPSAGIATRADREARRAADAALADRLERDGIAAFVTAWERNPVFATHAAVAPALVARQRAIRLANDPAGLAASLRGAGQGAMEPLGRRLAAVSAPTLVIGGELDAVGRPRAEGVARGIHGARLELLPDTGHTPHLERPIAFRRLVLDFLQEVPAR